MPTNVNRVTRVAPRVSSRGAPSARGLSRQRECPSIRSGDREPRYARVAGRASGAASRPRVGFFGGAGCPSIRSGDREPRYARVAGRASGAAHRPRVGFFGERGMPFNTRDASRAAEKASCEGRGGASGNVLIRTKRRSRSEETQSGDVPATHLDQYAGSNRYTYCMVPVWATCGYSKSFSFSTRQSLTSLLFSVPPVTLAVAFAGRRQLEEHDDRPLERAIVLLVEHVLIAAQRRRIALLQEQLHLRLLVGRDAAGLRGDLAGSSRRGRSARCCPTSRRTRRRSTSTAAPKRRFREPNNLRVTAAIEPMGDPPRRRRP